MHRKLSCALLTLLILVTAVLSVSCSSPAPSESLDSGSDTYTFTDDLGREVTVVSTERTAALLGSFADIWYLAGGEICATADDAWDDLNLPLPDDAINLGMTKSISLEQLLLADPTFVLASANTQGNIDIMDTLEAAGIPVAYFDVNNFDDYLRVLKTCTELTGRDDLYEQNGTDVAEQIEAVKAASAERIEGDGTAPKVLSLRASASWIRAKGSSGNVLGEMLADLGCINIADSDESLLESIGMEHIIAQDPDFVFFVPQGGDPDGIQAAIDEFISENPAWAELRAVKNDNVFLLDKQLYSLKPNARWGEAYEKLEAILADE